MKEMVTQFRMELSESNSQGTDEEVRLYDDVESLLRDEFGPVDLESVACELVFFLAISQRKGDHHGDRGGVDQGFIGSRDSHMIGSRNC